MYVQPDFRELLELFNSHEVEYIIVGGYALAFHGAPRTTGDIDIFIGTAPRQRPAGPGRAWRVWVWLGGHNPEGL